MTGRGDFPPPCAIYRRQAVLSRCISDGKGGKKRGKKEKIDGLALISQVTKAFVRQVTHLIKSR